MHFNKTLDLCYCSIKGTYKSVVQPPVGTADDNTVLLVPVYKNDLKRERSQTKSIMWSKESTAYLQGLSGMYGLAFFMHNSCLEIDELADYVSSHILFCEDMLIPCKTVNIFPNNKPCFTKYLEVLMNERCRTFYEDNLGKKIGIAERD